MSFSLKTRKVADVVILDMNGKLAIGEPVLLLRETIRKFIADGTKSFVLNLGEVSYIDSAGLGELITTYTSCRNRLGQAKLLNLSKKAKDLLQMTKLLTVFDCYESEAKAIESFKATGAKG